MAGVNLASITNEDDVSFLCVLAVIADPVHHLIRVLFIFHFPIFNKKLFSFKPERSDCHPAEWTFIRGFKPGLKAVETKFVFAFQLTTFLDLL